MNLHIISGRPTRDPEIYHYNPEKEDEAVAKFTLAVQKDHPKGSNTADFFNCVAFGRQEKLVEQYVKKGMKITLIGRMENNNYEVDGGKVFGFNLIIERIEFSEKKENSNEVPVQVAENGFMQVSEEVEKELEEVFGK